MIDSWLFKTWTCSKVVTPSKIHSESGLVSHSLSLTALKFCTFCIFHYHVHVSERHLALSFTVMHFLASNKMAIEEVKPETLCTLPETNRSPPKLPPKKVMHLPTLRFFGVELCVSGSVLGTTTTKSFLRWYPPGNQHIPTLGKRKIIFKQTLDGEYVSSQGLVCVFPVKSRPMLSKRRPLQRPLLHRRRRNPRHWWRCPKNSKYGARWAPTSYYMELFDPYKWPYELVSGADLVCFWLLFYPWDDSKVVNIWYTSQYARFLGMVCFKLYGYGPNASSGLNRFI